MSKPVTAISSLVYGLMLAPVTFETVLRETIVDSVSTLPFTRARSGSPASRRRCQ